ncbi:hypothetical protein [Paraburkholderia sp. CI3]|uniref:ABC transporter ATP-binding protein C-terminal domain-containing protein n=1 Tax=Paraburkholderia sp. CI3 TaxID=2991060 RepID=UPI003D2508EB
MDTYAPRSCRQPIDVEDGPLTIDRLKRANSEFGITLLIIEHNMQAIMNLAQHIYCLAHGELLASGPPESIQNDPRVVDAYLGVHSK